MISELPDVQAGFRKGRGTRYQIANIYWIIEKARVPEKHLLLLYWCHQSLCLVKAMVFPVVMYGCESWTIKKTERWTIDAFESWCWTRLLRVLWTARRSNQSILKEISPEYSLDGLMLKLKLQYLATWCEELTHWKRPWCWERLKAGGEGDDRGWDGWMASPTWWTWVWASFGSWWWTGKPGVLQSMGLQRVRHDSQTSFDIVMIAHGWVTELTDHICMGLFLGSHFCFIVICVCFNANAIQFQWLQVYNAV